MKTLKRLMIVCMALALVCMTAPLGHAQTLCKKCGVAAPIGQCPSGMAPGPRWDKERACVDIKNYGTLKPAWTIGKSPTRGAEVDSAYGLAPSWSVGKEPVNLLKPGSTTPTSGGFGYY